MGAKHRLELLAGTEYRYAMVNRPVGIGCCPKDLAGTAERPPRGKPHHDLARNGIAIYHRKLTDAETKSFEMALLVDSPKDMMEVAQPIISKLKHYAAGYVEMAESDPKDFQQTVYEFLKKTAPGYPPSIGDFEAFADLVVSGLKAHTSNTITATDFGDEPPKGWNQGDINVTFTPFCQLVRKELGSES